MPHLGDADQRTVWKFEMQLVFGFPAEMIVSVRRFGAKWVYEGTVPCVPERLSSQLPTRTFGPRSY